MAEEREQAALTSEGVDLARARRRAERAGLFRSLERVYAGFPETECEGCARCCFESPGIFFIEHLGLIEALAGMPEGRRERYLRRALSELLFSWIDAERKCVFLEGSRCAIYGQRPLACRLFGLVPPEEREQAEAQARMAARQEARRLGRLGIEVPEAVVTRALVSCERVRDRKGRPVRVDGDALAAQVARLDGALIPRAVVVAEFCFRSLPEWLGAAALGGDAVEALRVQLLRRAQKGEAVDDLLEGVWEGLRLPAELKGKRGRR